MVSLRPARNAGAAWHFREVLERASVGRGRVPGSRPPSLRGDERALPPGLPEVTAERSVVRG